MTSPTGSPTAAKHVLAISTSGPSGSLALGSQTVRWEKKAMQSELATLKLQELLNLSGVGLKQLTHVVVNVGPGSFTGIRVGINLARGLGYGLGLPVASVNALALLAFKNLAEGERGMIATKALQNFYYAAVYQPVADGLTEIKAPASVDRQSLVAFADPGAKALVEGQAPDADFQTDARDLLLFLDRWPNVKHFFPWKHATPLYIRASEAEEKMKKGLLTPLP